MTTDPTSELNLTDRTRRTVICDVLTGVAAGMYRTTNAGMTSTAGWLAPDEKQPLNDLYRAGMVTYEPTMRLTDAGVALAGLLGVDVDGGVR